MLMHGCGTGPMTPPQSSRRDPRGSSADHRSREPLTAHDSAEWVWVAIVPMGRTSIGVPGLPGRGRGRLRQVRVGAPDPMLAPVSGMLAVSELTALAVADARLQERIAGPARAT